MKTPTPQKQIRAACVLLLLATAFIVHSCKKDNPITASSTNVLANDMRQWLTSQKADTAVAGLLISEADWATAHTFSADSGKTYEAVKLPPLSTFDDPNKAQLRYLVLVKKDNKITTGQIYELYADKTQLTNPDHLLAAYSHITIDAFNGSMAMYSVQNKIMEGRTYVNGLNTVISVRTAQNKIPAKQIQGVKTPNIIYCTDWYWVTDGQISDAEFMYETCQDGGGGGGLYV